MSTPLAWLEKLHAAAAAGTPPDIDAPREDEPPEHWRGGALRPECEGFLREHCDWASRYAALRLQWLLGDPANLRYILELPPGPDQLFDASRLNWELGASLACGAWQRVHELCLQLALTGALSEPAAWLLSGRVMYASVYDPAWLKQPYRGLLLAGDVRFLDTNSSLLAGAAAAEDTHRLEWAADALERAFLRDSTQPPAYRSLLAACQYGLGRYIDAAVNWERYAPLAAVGARIPSLALIRAADAYECDGELARAINTLEECLRLQPGFTALRQRVAELHARTGDYRKAYQALNAAADNVPPLGDTLRAWYHAWVAADWPESPYQ
jgi:tetratricopeptide (TPR) repeat protein